MLEIGKVKDEQAPILRGDEIVATLRASNWKEEATLIRAGTEWALSRKKGRLIGTLTSDPQMSDTGEQARFRAEQVSLWKGTWELTLDGIRYALGPKSIWRGTQTVSRGGQEVAVSGKTKGWSARVTLEAANDVPLDHQLFLLWVVFILDRRAASAATSAAVVGGTAAASGS